MSHGDLTPGNVLTAGGHLVGVLDVGSYCAADPALDLISAWNLLEAGPRQVLRTALECTSLEWERSKAWAFEQAMGLVWYYADSNPVMSRLGRTTLDRIMSAAEVLSGPPPGSEDRDPGRMRKDGRRQLAPKPPTAHHHRPPLQRRQQHPARNGDSRARCQRSSQRAA